MSSEPGPSRGNPSSRRHKDLIQRSASHGEERWLRTLHLSCGRKPSNLEWGLRGSKSIDMSGSHFIQAPILHEHTCCCNSCPPQALNRNMTVSPESLNKCEHSCLEVQSFWSSRQHLQKLPKHTANHPAKSFWNCWSLRTGQEVCIARWRSLPAALSTAFVS